MKATAAGGEGLNACQRTSMVAGCARLLMPMPEAYRTGGRAD